MKSIRLSLIVYFLVLLTGALGAVSWLSYRTTAEALRESQLDSQKMIEKQFEAKSQAARDELDRHILRQARSMAAMPMISIPYETVFAASSIGLGALPVPGGPYNAPLWRLWLPYNLKPAVPNKEGVWPANFRYTPHLLAQDKDPKNYDLKRELQVFYPKHTHVQSSELLVANADADHAQEYFQTYQGKDGQPWQRSDSMGDAWFALDQERREQALYAEHYDTWELRPGVTVRRVTFKTPISGYGGMVFVPGWRPQGGPKGPAKGPPRAFDGRPPFDLAKLPSLFVQYAADLGPTEEKIQQFAAERDEQLAKLNRTITDDLGLLRDRMMCIGLVMLGAVWLGGYLVIRLGLAPLSKMSEAVSQVSPHNFHLPLDADNLPNELRPIALRLEEVLDLLQKAFAREKQASADISHELRTPLATLMTTLEVGLKKTRSLDEYREILDECRSSGRHMYQLVERLLTLARLDAGADRYRPLETDVTDLALNCADLIRPLARARGLTLRLHLSDPIATQTDPNKLREVLINLLHNAVEYNDPNGAIDLLVERINGHIRFEVRDTGIGIRPSELEHLFERFYRADPSRHADTPHAGLGLAIVKSYVDLLGGTIQVASGDAGTAFIVELPFVAPVHDLATAVQAEPVLVER